MKKKLVTLGIILSVAINIGFFSSLIYNKVILNFSHKRELINLKEKMGLSYAQILTINTLREKIKKEILLKATRLKDRKPELIECLVKKEVDMNKVNEILDHQNKIQREMMISLIHGLIDIRKELSEEQAKILFNFISLRIDKLIGTEVESY